jgi:hypothetical protein
VRLVLTRSHHLITEKYGHLDVTGSIELDTDMDHVPSSMSAQEMMNEDMDHLLEPTLERLNRSLDVPGDEEFVRAWVTAKEV